MIVALRLSATLFVLFLLPALATLAWWAIADRPASWRGANWSSAGLLPSPASQDAAIYVLAARTGGMKGALSVHVGSSRVDLQACKLEYSIVSPK